MKDYDNLDDLLKKSLSSKETPSIGVNVDLKIKIDNQIEENKGISIWWLPMIISTFMTGIGYVFIKAFMPPGIIQNLLILFSVVSAVFSIVMTFVGVKYFELRKGARVNI